MTSTITAPADLLAGVPVIGWGATDDEWLDARRRGISATDVSALLGFSPYITPAELWAEKTGRSHSQVVVSHAMELGHALEPWLLDQTSTRLDRQVSQTRARLYAHPEHPWRMASPDGYVVGSTTLIEAKTAGLAGGFGIPPGWSETTIPLGYNFQTRWQMHVLDAPEVWVPALVAGLGFRMYRIERDPVIEDAMVGQVVQWYERHILGDSEPPLGSGDLEALGLRYPVPTEHVIDLDDTDAYELWTAYRTAHEQSKQAKEAKDKAGAGLKALLGPHAIGTFDGDAICTWNAKDGAVDWQMLARDLAITAELPLPDLEHYRKPASRVLNVKGLTS